MTSFGMVNRFTLLALILMQFCIGTASAQTSVSVTLESMEARDDSITVLVHMGTGSDSLSVPVSAFEILLDIPEGLSLVSSSVDHTLTDKTGWTTAINAQRGWVGGFSSSLDALEQEGVLITLLLLKRRNVTAGEVCIRSVRLNSGSPEVDLTTPCTRY